MQKNIVCLVARAQIGGRNGQKYKMFFRIHETLLFRDDRFRPRQSFVKTRDI